MKGIYKNARIMHSAMNMIGVNVHVILKNGEIYEGIFSAISPGVCYLCVIYRYIYILLFNL